MPRPPRGTKEQLTQAEKPVLPEQLHLPDDRQNCVLAPNHFRRHPPAFVNLNIHHARAGPGSGGAARMRPWRRELAGAGEGQGGSSGRFSWLFLLLAVVGRLESCGARGSQKPSLGVGNKFWDPRRPLGDLGSALAMWIWG